MYIRNQEYIKARRAIIQKMSTSFNIENYIWIAILELKCLDLNIITGIDSHGLTMKEALVALQIIVTPKV